MANPQALNRYSYVLGNPLKYTDPTGHYCVGDDEDCADEAGDGPAPSGNSSGNNGNGGNGGGGDPHENDLPDPNPSGYTPPTLDPIDDENGEELTDFQLFGQVFTLVLIEVFVLMPIDYGLIVLTADATVACGLGVVLACIADIPILAIDLVVADFQISLANTIAQNVETGTRHEFEWIIIPNLLPEVKDD